MAPGPSTISHSHRALRQASAHAEAIRVFGDEAKDRRRLALRMAEEAFEFLQTQGLTPADLMKVAADVYARPPGRSADEMGDLALMMLNVSENLGISLDGAEASALARFRTINPDRLREKNAAKVARGLV